MYAPRMGFPLFLACSDPPGHANLIYDHKYHCAMMSYLYLHMLSIVGPCVVVDYGIIWSLR